MSCEELLRNLTKENGGYQPISYLPHLTSRRRKKIYDRMLKTITDFCGDVVNKSFLDIGTCYGYFCFELTKLGALTIGVESNNERFNICKFLRFFKPVTLDKDSMLFFHPQGVPLTSNSR